MRVERFTRRWPVLCLIAVLAMTAQSPRVTAADCYCHTLEFSPAGGGDWWYITAVCVSGGTGSCPGGVFIAAFVRSPECHRQHIPYGSCLPGDMTPCDHCPKNPSDGCPEDKMAAQQSREEVENIASNVPQLPRTDSTPFEGQLGEKLELKGPVKVKLLKIISDDGDPRWVKLNALTIHGKGNNKFGPLTIRTGFEIHAPGGSQAFTEVKESDLKTFEVENGPGEEDDWEQRLWEDARDKVTYTIRYRK